MKIGYVFDDSLDRPDGVQQAVIATGEWFRSQGHDVHYLVGDTKRTDLLNVHSLARSLRVRFNGNSMSTPLPTSAKSLRTFLAAEKFDVLHVTMPYSPFFAARVIKEAPQDTNIIGTFHILPYTRLNTIATKQLARLLRSSLKRFRHFVSVSEPAAAFAKASFGIESMVIPNPVHTAQFLPARKKLPAGPRRIVFLGRLEERKGIIELIKAYRHLLEHNPRYAKSTSLVVGGKGPLKDKVHAMVQELPRGSHVELLGFVPEQDKAALLASAAVAALPSTSGESFGIILVEAMAAGARLILAGNNPGYASVLGKRPELLVDPRDTAGFSAKLEWALTDTPETKDLSEWLRREAHQYDIAVIGAQLEALYRS